MEAYLDRYGDDDEPSSFRPFKNTRRRFDIDSDANEPKPYVYGLVGRTPNAPASPTPQETQPPVHNRTTSLTPLMVPGIPGTPLASGYEQVASGPNSIQSHDNNSLNPGVASASRSSSFGSHLNHSAGGALVQGGAPTSSGSHYSNELGSPVQSPTSASTASRPVLRIANNEEPPSPTSSIPPRETKAWNSGAGSSSSGAGSSFVLSRPEKSTRRTSGQPATRSTSNPVIVHMDGGRISADDDAPPAYGTAL